MSSELAWISVGLVAQGCFTARFLVQLIASERCKKSVIPLGFWYLSLLGGTMLLGYAIHLGDPVFILGQTFGVLVYYRNLTLLRSRSRREPLVHLSCSDCGRHDMRTTEGSRHTGDPYRLDRATRRP
jgi:lipid-A-disaccharide synthase-like uncharacterized protein